MFYWEICQPANYFGNHLLKIHWTVNQNSFSPAINVQCPCNTDYRSLYISKITAVNVHCPYKAVLGSSSNRTKNESIFYIWDVYFETIKDRWETRKIFKYDYISSFVCFSHRVPCFSFRVVFWGRLRECWKLWVSWSLLSFSLSTRSQPRD